MIDLNGYAWVYPNFCSDLLYIKQSFCYAYFVYMDHVRMINKNVNNTEMDKA